MISHLSWPLFYQWSFIGCKWSDCVWEFRSMLMVCPFLLDSCCIIHSGSVVWLCLGIQNHAHDYPSLLTLVLSSIGSKWYDCVWEFRIILMISHLSWAHVLSFIGSKWSDCVWEFRIMFMISHLFWALGLSFIGSKWSDCGQEFRIILMIPHSSWALVLSFIGSKLSDCVWEFRIVLMITHLSWALVLSFIGSK